MSVSRKFGESSISALVAEFEQYWNGTTYQADWRNGDATTLTYIERPSTLQSGTYYDNYRFIPSTGFALVPKDENRQAPSVYYSDNPGDTLELQIVGESFALFGITDTSFGTGEISVDDEVVGEYDWDATPTDVVIATMESGEGWDSDSTDDTTNHKEASSSRRLTLVSANAIADSAMVFGSTQDYSSVDGDTVFLMWVYISDASKANYVQILFDSTSSSPSAFTKFYYANWHENLVDGWNLCAIRKSEFISQGGPSWSTIYKLRIKLSSNASGGLYASFDDAKWREPVQIYTASGLSPYEDHKLLIEVVTGNVFVSRVEVTATKTALETNHRDSVLMIAPTLASLGVLNNDSDLIDKAVNLMETYRLHNQLGDRTTVNRSRLGSLGVGGFEQSNYISGSNYITPGTPTTTSTAFNGVMIGLAYLVLESVSTLDQKENWKNMLLALGAYAETRGYTDDTYYNTGNANLLYAVTFGLIYRITQDEKWYNYAYTSANAYLLSPVRGHRISGDFDLSFNTNSPLTDSGYLEEDAKTTTLGSDIDAVATSITLASGGKSALGIASLTNMVVEIDEELIRLTSNTSGETWSCERGYGGSTASAHTAGDTVRRGFDYGYVRIQAPAAYLLGLILNDNRFISMSKLLFNAVDYRVDLDTLDMDIRGGSRNNVEEAYATNIIGVQSLSSHNGEIYPADADIGDIEARYLELINTHGFVPADVVANVASNIVQSFAFISFAFGFANSMAIIGDGSDTQWSNALSGTSIWTDVTQPVTTWQDGIENTDSYDSDIIYNSSNDSYDGVTAWTDEI